MTVIEVGPGEGPIVNLDDDESFHILMRSIYPMSKLPLEFIPFTDSTECLKYFEEVKAGRSPLPTLFLVDVDLVVHSGFDVVGALRADPFFADVPFIAMFSNSAQPSEIGRATEVGANHYYKKPMNIVELRFVRTEKPARLA